MLQLSVKMSMLAFLVLFTVTPIRDLQAFNDTLEISNYNRYNISLFQDNNSIYNSSDSAISWSYEPKSDFYTLQYKDDLYFIVKSSFNNSVDN